MEIFIIPIVIIASSFWVFYDAKNHNLGSADSNTPSPFKMAIGCFFIWILCFPYYLIKRRKFIDQAKLNPNSEVVTSGQKVVLFVAACIIFGLTYKDFSSGALPECHSQEATQLVSEIVEDNYGEGYSLSDFGQVNYDSSAESRHCRMTWSVNDSTGITDFIIEWYSDKKESFTVEIQ